MAWALTTAETWRGCNCNAQARADHGPYAEDRSDLHHAHTHTHPVCCHAAPLVGAPAVAAPQAVVVVAVPTTAVLQCTVPGHSMLLSACMGVFTAEGHLLHRVHVSRNREEWGKHCQ
jgi:hypothetical protein